LRIFNAEEVLDRGPALARSGRTAEQLIERLVPARKPQIAVEYSDSLAQKFKSLRRELDRRSERPRHYF